MGYEADQFTQECFFRLFEDMIILLFNFYYRLAYFALKLFLIVDQGADVNAVSRLGNTPLHLAADNGQLQIAELLLQRGAKVDVDNAVRSTPLVMAVQSEHAPVVKLLLEHGADPELKNKMKETALSIAQRRNNKEILELIKQSEQKGGLFNFF